MSRRIPAVVLTAAFAALAIGSAVPATIYAAPAQSDATVSRSFDVGAGGTLEVSAAFGSIEITTTSGNRVEARVVREVRDRYDDDSAQILAEHLVDMSQNGNDVTVRAEVSEDARERWKDDYRNTPLRVRLEIAVPASYNVDLETRGGNISVADLDGEVRAETSGGNIEFGNVSGTVWGRTSGGNVTLERSSANAEVRTSGGNIEIGDVEGRVVAETSGGSIRIERAGGEVRAETSGGNVTVDDVAGAIDAHSSGGNVTANITRQPASDCRLSTSAGSVTVTVASGIGLDIDASTSIGGVSSDFAVDGRVSRNSISGAINGGGPELRLRTSAGSIRIRER
jgi:hypothetical protein